MEETVQGISDAQAALYGGLGGGLLGGVFALLGVLIGLYGSRALRHFGEVECIPRLWKIEWWFSGRGAGPDTRSFVSVSTSSEARTAMRAQCQFKAEFFNEKEVPAGVTGMSLVFLKEGKPEVVHSLMAPNIQEYEGGMSIRGEFEAFTLQPREVFPVDLETGIHEEEQKENCLNATELNLGTMFSGARRSVRS